jgi:hypothetical protein
MALADTGDDAARAYIERLEPVEANVTLGRLLFRQGKGEEAMAALEAAYLRYRADPWPLPWFVLSSLAIVEELIARDARLAGRAWNALREPFVLRMSNEARMNTVVSAASRTGSGEACAPAFAAFEPNPVWQEEFLVLRARCYAATGSPLAAPAERDAIEFRAMQPPTFLPGL